MSSFRVAVPAPLGRIALATAFGFMALAAWLVVWISEAGFHHALHFQGGMETAAHGLAAIFMFAVAWTGMSVAMMLPTSLPVLMTLHTFAGEKEDRSLLVALAAAGYVGAWAAVGVLLGPVCLLMQNAMSSPSAAGTLGRVATPSLLLFAGLFQFSALKYRCLEKCRSPLGFVLSHWRGQNRRRESFRLGWASGVYCVGCCWALMLLMLVTTVQHLALMLGLGLVMAVEKNVRWGRRISAPLGVLLIACAVALFFAGGDLGSFSRTLVREFCGAP